MPIAGQEVSIDWLTVTLKYDNHGGKGNAAHRDHGGALGLLRIIEHKLDLTTPDENLRRKTLLNKGM